MSIRAGWRAVFLMLWFLPVLAGSAFSRNMETVQITTTKMGEGVYMLTGAGGNIGVCAGADGILLIDSQFPQLHDKITTALAAIAPGAVRFLFNTNWHYDHVSGNELFARAGAVIIGHENTRRRMAAAQSHDDLNIKLPPYPDGALPMVTFAGSLAIHINGEELDISPMAAAHSEFDLLFHFRKANVIHTGDLLFSGTYPYIDVEHGGSVNGMIDAAEKIIGMCNDETRLIPGHGPAMKKPDAEAFRDMLVRVRERVSALLREGKSEAEIIAARPTADLDGRWNKGVPDDSFVTLLYKSLSKK
jgi:cyclase